MSKRLPALYEQRDNVMPAYVVFIRDQPPHDPEQMSVYQAMNRKSVPSSLPFGIKPLAVYGATEALEGKAPDGTVILQFPSMAKAKAWYHSAEYQAALPYRLNASDYRAFIIDGLGS
jgi:uncharacterized protein (DUF1330 family)